MLAALRAELEGKRLLLVEDDSMLRRATTIMLTKTFGIEPIIAHDGAEARVMLEKEAVDIVVTDYFMPNFDGAQLSTWIRSKGLDIPIIAITAASISAERDPLIAAGADVVLFKPIDAAEFAIAAIQVMTMQKAHRLAPASNHDE